MQTVTVDALVGRKLEGRYRILDRIARGGMSTVYAAVDERLDRLVAVKVMNAGLSADPAFSDRFAREARAAARLTHTNAVSVYDQGHEVAPDGHHVFLVMELVEGRTLRELIRERSKLTPAEAVSIMEPVLSALSAAHRAGLVHRDVKPENILLSDEGLVKVADFGLARAIESDPSSTRTGLMMGTVAYCAPEQVSKGNADPRSDVYSAGVVFFELLTGHPPYRGESAMNIAYQHVHSRVPAPSSRVRGIPSEIDEIVVAATDSDPTSRPSDAGAFLAELADVRAELALPVVPVPPRARLRKAHRSDQRHRTPDQATTETLRGQLARHDPSMAAQPPSNGTQRLDSGRLDDRRGDGHENDALPPPVVIPPPKQRKNGRPHRRRRGLIVALLILALGVGAFFGARAFIAWRFAHIPDVGNMLPGSAQSELQDAGYHVLIQPGPEFSETVQKGRVVSTDPVAGTRLATGKTVSITISAGPQLYPIPQLRNRTPQQAIDALAAIGLDHVSSTYQRATSTSVRRGRVISVSPASGTRVRSSTEVTITVSLGPPMVRVPSIEAGTSVSTARDLVTSHHLHLGTDRVWDDTVVAGEIITCTPSADKLVVEDSAVKCTVSKGPHLVVVPSITIGTPVAQAVAEIQAAGLVPRVMSLPAGGRALTVLTVRDAGKTVHYGSTVLIYALPS